MFELLVQIVVKMTEAKRMRGLGKHMVDPFDKALLSVRENNDGIAGVVGIPNVNRRTRKEISLSAING